MTPINLFSYGCDQHYNYVAFNPFYDGFACHFSFMTFPTLFQAKCYSWRHFDCTGEVYLTMTFRQAAKLYPHLFTYKSI